MGMGYLLEAIKHNIKQENKANILYFPVFPRISPYFPVFPRISPYFPVFPRISPYFPVFPTFGSISWGGISREILPGKYRPGISQTTLSTIILLCK